MRLGHPQLSLKLTLLHLLAPVQQLQQLRREHGSSINRCTDTSAAILPQKACPIFSKLTEQHIQSAQPELGSRVAPLMSEIEASSNEGGQGNG